MNHSGRGALSAVYWRRLLVVIPIAQGIYLLLRVATIAGARRLELRPPASWRVAQTESLLAPSRCHIPVTMAGDVRQWAQSVTVAKAVKALSVCCHHMQGAGFTRPQPQQQGLRCQHLPAPVPHQRHRGTHYWSRGHPIP